ncbi:MAG: lysophospholipid acyltransferase family protein [Chloroherpetonaceae bacterium]|nr:lysophospholipid acyltransferase family protein [Chloroherpetonaceae bacterium]
MSKILLPALMRLLYLTLRKRVEGEMPKRKNAIIAFWHGKMLVGWLLARSLVKPTPCYAVVSLSKDGALLANALERLGFGLIRGSSSRGKEEVKAEMKSKLNEGNAVAITPDGPRGPREVFKYGSARIASETQTPIVFADIDIERKWRLEKSWDKFEIPKPFSRVMIRLAEINAPKFETEDDLKAFANSLTAKFQRA